MTNLEKMTLEDLMEEKEDIKRMIRCHERGNDFYYLSGQYKSDHSKLHAVEKEIERRNGETK